MQKADHFCAGNRGRYLVKWKRVGAADFVLRRQRLLKERGVERFPSGVAAHFFVVIRLLICNILRRGCVLLKYNLANKRGVFCGKRMPRVPKISGQYI